jgi:hypothetical protein
MKPKLARKSMGKDPYECQKPWPEDCFCQCGGDGIVLVTKVDDTPSEANDAVPKKKSYRTAFFEAFPKSPKCFIRGEGDFIEEAEARAFEKFNKILACTNHEWDRRDRTDGYAYCTKCPLSGSYLDPLTKCVVCQTPTSRYTDKSDVHYCRVHYYQLSADQVIGEKEWFGVTVEEQKSDYLLDQAFHNALLTLDPNLTEEAYRKMNDMLIHIQAELNAKYNPLFGPQTKTKIELHQMVMQDLPVLSEIIYKKITSQKP